MFSFGAVAMVEKEQSLSMREVQQQEVQFCIMQAIAENLSITQASARFARGYQFRATELLPCLAHPSGLGQVWQFRRPSNRVKYFYVLTR